jgi:hypothetical protein
VRGRNRIGTRISLGLLREHVAFGGVGGLLGRPRQVSESSKTCLMNVVNKRRSDKITKYERWEAEVDVL